MRRHNVKNLHCKDVGFECDHVIRAESEEEVLRQAADHAKSAHNTEITPEVAKKVKSLIRDVL
jgi:predicted small metal-binding protein